MAEKTKWIGPEMSAGGSYRGTNCDELCFKIPGTGNVGSESFDKKIYLFESRFGVQYYISDETVVSIIDKFLQEDRLTGLYEYLYNLVVERFGMIDFLMEIGHKIARERDKGYKAGKNQIRKEFKELMNIE